jgi:hypothetical protein
MTDGRSQTYRLSLPIVLPRRLLASGLTPEVAGSSHVRRNRTHCRIGTPRSTSYYFTPFLNSCRCTALTFVAPVVSVASVNVTPPSPKAVRA